MKLLTASLHALGTISVPASVEAQTRTFLEDCEQYEVTETYTPGQLSMDLFSRSCKLHSQSCRICGGAFQHMNYYSQSLWFISATTLSSTAKQLYQQPQQPIHQAQCEGKILRMNGCSWWRFC